MKHKSNQTSVCPIARSLDVMGEWWSLLIVRDAMLGIKRFSEFERRLGMAKNILAARLKTLVRAGIFKVVPASDGSAYSEYELTAKGKDLLPAMIDALIAHPRFPDADLGSLRTGVVLSSDPVVLRRAAQELGVRGIVTGFGLTETTGLVTRCRWNQPLDACGICR